VEHILQQTPHPDLRVLVIWEPILPTDWAAPGSGTLARLADPRAVQFWDKGHLLARELEKSLAASASQPDCCKQAGNLWDLAALYPKGARWAGLLPGPVFINGPVVQMREQIQKHLAALLTSTALEEPNSSHGAKNCGLLIDNWPWSFVISPLSAAPDRLLMTEQRLRTRDQGLRTEDQPRELELALRHTLGEGTR
jgi:hypothetical protein